MHTTYRWNIKWQKWAGISGLWVLNEIIQKKYPENMKKKSWEPFGSYLLNSTANPGHFHANWAGLPAHFYHLIFQPIGSVNAVCWCWFLVVLQHQISLYIWHEYWHQKLCLEAIKPHGNPRIVITLIYTIEWAAIYLPTCCSVARFKHSYYSRSHVRLWPRWIVSKALLQ